MGAERESQHCYVFRSILVAFHWMFFLYSLCKYKKGLVFHFIIFDSSSKATFIASDADGSVPFFWGTDAENHLVLADDVETVKKGCGKSFAPFPKGCFFSSTGGLKSYEHPLNELKAMPRVDSSGQVCGATFSVDVEAKKESTGMKKVGSAANWSSNY